MKKNFKRIAAALAVTGTMAMTMGMTAFAVDSNYNTSQNSPADTGSINLIKDYDRAENTQEDSVSPKEDFKFTITRYGVWNAGYMDEANKIPYNKDNIPLLGTPNATNTETVVTVSADKGDAGKIKDEKEFFNSTAITIPTYLSVGDFWYQVEETDNHVTGVTYATNDEDKKYYIHVQVINGDEEKPFYRLVTLHKTAPTADSGNNIAYNDETKESSTLYTANKVNDIQNTYSAGTLTVEKVVEGNAGDKDKRFEIQVTFTKPKDTIINSEITYTASLAEKEDASLHSIIGQGSGSQWNDAAGYPISAENTGSATNTVTIWVKNGEPVTFNNIPYGVSYTVEEMNTGNKYSNDKYLDPVYALSNNEGEDSITTKDAAWGGKIAKGKVSDANDTVTIKNKKDVTIDVGVLLSNAPYAAMLALAGTAGVVFVKRRKKDIED